MKIPKDIQHTPLLNEDLTKNEDCLLWQIPGQLENYLKLSYPEVYAFLQENDRQPQEQPQD